LHPKYNHRETHQFPYDAHTLAKLLRHAASAAAQSDRHDLDADDSVSYSYWQVGQYTRFAGVEGESQGDVHFCDEHTSIDSQGLLGRRSGNG
jgi:hypothetical protein